MKSKTFLIIFEGLSWKLIIKNFLEGESPTLKHKVVIFAELIKGICGRVNFSKVRDLQPATLVTLNTFNGICQGFCLT